VVGNYFTASGMELPAKQPCLPADIPGLQLA